jgi:hypothetical protein
MERPYEPYLQLLPSLKARFSEAFARYANLRDHIRPSITRWEWATYPRHALQPFGMWLWGHPQPGRLIKSEPKSKNRKYHHGYDASDRVVLTEAHTEFEGQFYEQYLEYFDDRIELTYYSYAADKECINVETLVLEGERPIAFVAYADGGDRVAAYDYDQGRIARFWIFHQNDRDEIVQEGTVIYEDGAVDRIEFGGEVILKDGRRRSLSPGNETKPVPGSLSIPTINPRSAKKHFLLALGKAGHQLATLTPKEGFELMLALYRDERAKGCSLAEDGDMLLFQSGTHEQGRKEFLEIDMTRQLTETDSAESAMRQLSLTFRFPMQESWRALGASNRWCMTPNELDDFRAFIWESAAWKEVASLQAAKVLLSSGEV